MQHTSQSKLDLRRLTASLACLNGVSCACARCDALIGQKNQYASICGKPDSPAPHRPRQVGKTKRREKVWIGRSTSSQNLDQQLIGVAKPATMARSKAVTKKEKKSADAPLVTKVTNGTPYQLDPAQVDRATKALAAHMKQHVNEKEEKAPVKNLADDEDEAEENDQPIFLSVTTKKHLIDGKRLKPTKMSVLKTASYTRP